MLESYVDKSSRVREHHAGADAYNLDCSKFEVNLGYILNFKARLRLFLKQTNKLESHSLSKILFTYL